jgi:hypothetical protein
MIGPLWICRVPQCVGNCLMRFCRKNLFIWGPKDSNVPRYSPGRGRIFDVRILGRPTQNMRNRGDGTLSLPLLRWAHHPQCSVKSQRQH